MDGLTKWIRQNPHLATTWAVQPGPFIDALPFLWIAVEGACPGSEDSKHDTPTAVNSEWQISVSFISANVNSLYFGPSGFCGKLAFITEQLESLRPNFVGVQESRTPVGWSQSGSFLRFCSGAHGGHFGTELWVNLKQPHAYCQGTPVRFQAHHFAVFARPPTLLVVRCSAPEMPLWIVVGHGPQSGHSEDTKQQWWDHFATLLTGQDMKEIVLLLDANASPQHETCVSAGAQFNQDLLSDFKTNFFLEDTSDSGGHRGGLTTWTSPDGTYSKALDYVLASAWQASCTWSALLDDILLTPEHHDAPGPHLLENAPKDYLSIEQLSATMRTSEVFCETFLAAHGRPTLRRRFKTSTPM